MISITNKQISDIETAIVLSVQERQQMKEEVKEIKWEMKEIKLEIKGFDAKLDALLDKMENKFAPKRTEKALIRVITAMCGGVITWIVKLVIK